MAKDIADSIAEINLLLPDNISGEISPADIRTVNSTLASSNLNTLEQNNQSISGLVDFNGGITENGNDLKGKNVIWCSSISDFPAPIAGTILLESGVSYLISGLISFGTTTITFGTSSIIAGTNISGDILTYTGTGTFINGATTDVSLSRLTVQVIGAGKLFDITNASNVGVVSFDLCRFIGAAGSGLGSISGGQVFNLDSVIAVGFDDSLTLDGSMDRFSISKSAIVESFIELSATLSIITGDISLTGFTTDTGQTSLVDLGVTVVNRIKIESCSHAGLGTFGTGLSSNVDFLITGNDGIDNTQIGAQGYISGSLLNTSFSGLGAGNAVPVNFGTGFNADIENEFTISNAGRFTYNGKDNTLFTVSVTLFATISGGATKRYEYHIAKNGVIIASSISVSEYDGSNPDNSSGASIVSLTTGDYFELYVYASTSTTNLNVDTCSINIIGAP